MAVPPVPARGRATGGAVELQAQRCLGLLHHLLHERQLQVAASRPYEKHEPKAQENERRLNNRHPLLEHQFVCKERQARANSQHFPLVLLAPVLELDNRRLPQLVVLLPLLCVSGR